MSSLALTLVVGLSTQATTAALVVLTLVSISRHANVRTPRWLGYIVQRSESPSWHHARGRQRNNYADVSLFDILFGTFDKPARLRPGDMLLFREVSVNPLTHGNPQGAVLP